MDEQMRNVVATVYQILNEAADPGATPSDTQRGNAVDIHTDSAVRVVAIHDVVAAKFYGKGTNWDISGPDAHTYFDMYATKGPFFVMLPTQPKVRRERFILWFENGRTPTIFTQNSTAVTAQDLATRFPEAMKAVRASAQQWKSGSHGGDTNDSGRGGRSMFSY